jgi:hypothetical protein
MVRRMNAAHSQAMWAQFDAAMAEKRAHARMYDAAPDMLAALQCASSVLFLLSDEVKALHLRGQNVPDMVHAAIQKATGEKA